ncbi:unnamed protein product [Calicophoron daubneyi]|uniref:Nucleolar protein 56 n=1 Tax=Calicophoron daubneyi TaxID=300641 RepID=A0AAV2TKJ8_CALDB
MTKVFILFEHALGLALIKVKAADVEAVVELSKELLDDDQAFRKKFKLLAFAPFGSSAAALQNCNSISEGVVHEDLRNFLLEHLPLESPVLLCVGERKLADALKAPETGLPEGLVCSSESALLEVYRVIRLHFPTYIKELSHFAESTAQIGLGHSYSRAKVKFNIYRNDNMIIQSINLLDQLDKDINVFCMRIKEWFSYHFPELVKIVPDNVAFINVINIIRTREGATEENLEALEAATDGERAQSIIDAAKLSFGFDITEEDAENLSSFTAKIMLLVDRRKRLQDYLASKLSEIAPNLSTVAGERVSARLISHAGSLMNLAKFPASTIQVLGAEKALFRALRHRGKTPKYGLIYHSPFITRASRENKGRISRLLAAKCAIACRVDCFSEMLNDIYGKHLKKQIEDRLTFYETGTPAPTNAEAMTAANAEVRNYIRRMKKKAIKMLNGRKSPTPEEAAETAIDVSDQRKKKKKKRKVMGDEVEEQPSGETVVQESSVVESHVSFAVENEVDVDETLPKDKKKKKKKRHFSESVTNETEHNNVEDVSLRPVHKKRKRTLSESSVADLESDVIVPKKKMKGSAVV